MKNIRYLLLICTLFLFLPVHAQTEFSRKQLKKEIRKKLKAEKYSDADNQLRKAMEEHPELMTDVELNFIETGIQDELAEAENKKIFLGSNPDTAKYFSHIYGVYHYAMATGYGSKKYRRQLSNYMMQYRNNLRSAGVFHFKKNQYKEAYKYFDIYLATTDYPLLTSNSEYRIDPDTAAIARLTAISAFGSKQYTNTLYYLDIALTDTVNMVNMLEIGTRAGLAQGDTATAFGYMQKGWQRDSTNRFFSLALIDYYQQKQDYQNVLSVTDQSLVSLPKDSTTMSQLYYIRGKSQELLGHEDAALVSFDSAMSYAPNDVKAYHSSGLIYLRQAHKLAETDVALPGTKAYQEYKNSVNTLYDSAMHSFEAVRRLSPKDPSMWLSELRECYYRLNKGKELKKLEQYEQKS